MIGWAWRCDIRVGALFFRISTAYVSSMYILRLVYVRAMWFEKSSPNIASFQ